MDSLMKVALITFFKDYLYKSNFALHMRNCCDLVSFWRVTIGSSICVSINRGSIYKIWRTLPVHIKTNFTIMKQLFKKTLWKLINGISIHDCSIILPGHSKFYATRLKSTCGYIFRQVINRGCIPGFVTKCSLFWFRNEGFIDKFRKRSISIQS